LGKEYTKYKINKSENFREDKVTAGGALSPSPLSCGPGFSLPGILTL